MKQFDNIYVKRFGYFNVYVIKGNDGDVVIDTGFILMKRSLKRWLDQFNVKLIILTHAHVDHVWNTAYLKALYGCEVAISEDDIINLDNRKIKTYKGEWYTVNSIFGNDWARFYYLLGGR